MAQDGGARDGTFHGEMDRCRESQGWTTTCSSMSERDGKSQGDDSSKGSVLVLVRSPYSISHKWRELVSSGRFCLPMPCCLSLELRYVFFCYLKKNMERI